MKHEKICTWAFALLATSVLFGCSVGPKVVKLYPGPQLSDDQLATLTWKWMNKPSLKVDGKLLKEPDLPFYQEIKLIPGLHEITWTWGMIGASWVYKGSGALDAKATHIYDVYFAYLAAEPPLKFGENPVADWATWIQDRNTAEVVLGDKPSWAETGVAHVRATRM